MKKILPLFLFIALFHASSAQKRWPQEQLNRLWAQRNPDLLAQYERLKPVSNYLSFCEKNGQTGLVDSTGKVILKPRYDYGHRYQDKAIIIMGNEGKKGAFNFLGERILPIKYTQLIPFKSLLWATTATDTLLFTTEGKKVNNPELAQVLSENSKEINGYFSAAIENKWGIVDPQGHWAIQPEFNYINEVYENGAYWIGVTDTGKVLLHPATQWRSRQVWNNIQVFTPNGFWAKNEGERAYSFYNFEEKKVIGVMELDDPGYSSTPRIVKKGGKTGLMTADTSMVLPLIFEDIRNIGSYYNSDMSYEIVFAVKDSVGVRLFSGKKWLVDKYFRRVENDKKRELVGFIADSTFIYNNEGDLLHQLNLPNGELLYQRWLVSKINRDSVWHIDLGWIKVPGDAYNFYGEKEGLIINYTNNTSSLMNDAGKIVLEQADEISDHFGIIGGGDMEADWGVDMGITAKTKIESIQYQKGKLFGWVVVDGSHIEPARYEQVMPTGQGSFMVQKNLLYGLVSDQGKLLIPIEYTDQKLKKWGENRTFFLKKGTFWYLFDTKTGKQLTSEKLLSGAFDSSTGLSWGLTATGWQVFHSTTGKPILPTPVPEVIQGCYRGYVYQKNEKYGVIGLDGKVLVPFEWDTIVNCIYPPWGRKSGKITVWGDGFKRRFEITGTDLRNMDNFAIVHRDSLWHLIRIESGLCAAKGYPDILNIGGPVGHYGRNQWDILNSFGQVRTTLTADTLLLYSQGLIEVKNGQERYIYQPSRGKKMPLRYEKVTESNNDYLLTENKGKQGLTDKNLQEILPCKYSKVMPLSSNPDYLQTTLNDSTGLYYKDGSVCIPEDKYDAESLRRPNRDHYAIKKAGKTGHYSLSQRQWTYPVTERVFFKEESPQLVPNLFKFWVNGMYGIIDQNNKEVIPPQYSRIDKPFNSKMILLYKGDKCQRFNPLTRQLDTTLYDDVRLGFHDFSLFKVGKMNYLFKEDQVVFKTDTVQLDLIHGKNIRFMDPVTHLYGIIDTTGRIILQTEYENLGYYYNESEIMIARKNGKFGALNSELHTIIPFEFTHYEIDRRAGYFFYQGNKRGFYDENGTQILPPLFDTIIIDEKTTHFVAASNGQYRFYNQTGQLLHNTNWDAADTYSGGLAAVKKEGRWGYINVKGQVVIPIQYQYASKFRAMWWKDDALVVEDHQYKVIDKDGRLNTQLSLKDIFSTDSWDPFEPKLQIESPSNTRAYTEIPFEKVGYGNGYYIVQSRSSGKVGLVDLLGEWAILPQYVDIRMNDTFHYRQALACVFNGTKWTLLGRDLQPIGDFQYDSIEQAGDGLFLVKKGGNSFKINEKGVAVP